MTQYTDWGKLNAWHRATARELAQQMLTVAQVAVLRDAADIDREHIQTVHDMAVRLAEELPR
ncbi:hypothetical protein [Microbacterium sp. LWS13-1.2]|uniref:Uncharacterized protein n=1 Tax=Microbacterium sp. LWS13-1.2 TaxID=3135264 RepID=A0AAU6S7G2_9MICO